jgi:uncharacterized Zn finger protein
MCSYSDDSPQPLRTADLKNLAKDWVQRLQNEGQLLHPVTAHGRNLAKEFWGKQWMRHLSESEVYGMRLAPGRTLFRCGCVLDLQIETGKIQALVAEEGVWNVNITIHPLDDEQLETLKANCASRLKSWISLLKGDISPDLMELLVDPDKGILPNYSDWQMDCNCLDWADPCRHAAATLYATGAILDEHPELLFTLRGIQPSNLLPDAQEVASEANEAASSTQLGGQDLSQLFGINLDS